MPDRHWKTIRCTNLIERVIHEVRRRTKVMETIDNEMGCYGIAMGAVREQNERWSKRSQMYAFAGVARPPESAISPAYLIPDIMLTPVFSCTSRL